jgi:hypothetical protein
MKVMNAMRSFIAAALLIALSSLDLGAQSLSGPTLGFVKDEKGTKIWPLLGILGSSVPGRSLELPSTISNAVISSNNDYALAVQTDDAQSVIIKLDVSNPAVLPLAGIHSNASPIAISPSGAAAAFYSADSKLLQLVSGLPEAPGIVYEFDASVVQGDISEAAISDDAQLAILNVKEGDGFVLWAVPANGMAWAVLRGGPSRISFMFNRRDAWVADSASHEVYVLQSLDQQPARLPGFVFPETSAPFAGIASSRDGRTLFVTQRGSGAITMVDLESGMPSVLSCGCNAAGLFPLKGGSIFRVNALQDGPITVLDASSADARIFLIPPDPDVLGFAPSKEQPAQ